MAYTYINPVEQGYVRIPVTRKKHNKLFKLRQKRIGAKVEYYYNEENKILIVQYLTSNIAKAILIPVMLIPSILMRGIPETFKDIADVIYERKRGKFVEEKCFLNFERPTDEELKKFIADAIKKIK